VIAGIAILGAASCPAAAGDPFIYEDWQLHSTADGIPHDRIEAIHVADGHVWIGTAGGLARYDGSDWTAWTAEDGLPCPVVSAIDVDPRTGDVWLGTWGGGLVRLSGGRFDQFDQLNSGLAGNLVFAVAVRGNRVWAATNGGLSACSVIDDTWTLDWARRADAPETALTSLALDDRGLYAAAWCGGLRRIDFSRGLWSTLTDVGTDGPATLAPGATPRDATLAVTSAGDATWWVTQDALLRGDGNGVWERRAIPDPSRPGRFVGCIAAAGDLGVALGTDQGLDILTDWTTATWVRYERATGRVILHRRGRVVGATDGSPTFPGARIRRLAFEGDDLWIGTDRGVMRATSRRPWPGDGASESRADPSPTAVPTGAEAPEYVRIGLLRPGERMISIAGSDRPGVPRLGEMDWMAVNLALERANADGGFRGQIPFALATGPKGSFRGWGWTTPEDDFPDLARQSDVWGIVGHLGPGSAVTTAAALRTEVPLINCASTPATLDETLNPWIFRYHGGDPHQARDVTDKETEPAHVRFQRDYTARFKRPPGPDAFALFEATRHLLAAIEDAGLDREAVRRTLERINREEK